MDETEEINDVAVTDSMNGSCDVSEINVVVLNVVNDTRKENNGVVGSEKETNDYGTSDDNNGVNCAATSNTVKENNYLFEHGKENNDVVGFENDSETDDDRKGVSCDATSNEVKEKNDVIGSKNIPAIQSSIVYKLRTRVGFKKKMLDNRVTRTHE